jgi:UDP-glucosyltransferase BX8/BX9
MGAGGPGTALRGRARELCRRAAECVAKAGSSDLNVDKLVNHIMSLTARRCQ